MKSIKSSTYKKISLSIAVSTFETMKSWLANRKSVLSQAASEVGSKICMNVITPNTIPQFVIPINRETGSSESVLSETQESDEQQSVCSGVHNGSPRHPPTSLTLELPDDRLLQTADEPKSCPCSPVIERNRDAKREFSSAECLRALVYMTQKIRRKSANSRDGSASRASLSPDAEQNKRGRLLSIGTDQCVRQRSGSESQLKLMSTRRSSGLKLDEPQYQRNKSASFSTTEPLRNTCLRSALEKDVDQQRNRLAQKNQPESRQKNPSPPRRHSQSRNTVKRRQSSLTSADERLYLAGTCPQVKIEKSNSIDQNGFDAESSSFQDFSHLNQPLYKSQSQGSGLSDVDDTGRRKLSIRQLCNGKLKFSVQYLPGSEQLKVHVTEGEDVGGAHQMPTVNCCVKLSLMPGKLQKMTTKTVKNTRNPIFNEEFHFTNLSIEALSQLHLRLKLVNRESQFAKPEDLGEVRIRLDPLDLTTETIFRSRVKPTTSLLVSVLLSPSRKMFKFHGHFKDPFCVNVIILQQTLFLYQDCYRFLSRSKTKLASLVFARDSKERVY